MAFLSRRERRAPRTWWHAAAFVALSLASAGCVSGPANRQRDYVRFMRPARVAPPPGASRTSDVLVLRIRAYADADYEAQVDGWADAIREQIRRASEVTELQFGVRLELESVRPWDRPEHGDGLGQALDQLAATDAAREVDWVTGFVSGLSSAQTKHEHLGIARVFGRHLVLRAMQSRADADGFAVSFDALSPAERADFLRELRVHRETAVLLHEWAHTLGAVHECAGKSLMAPRYSVLQAEFSPESLPVIRAGLAHRGTLGIEARRAWAEEYRRAARNMADAAWNCPEQESALVEAQSTLDKLAIADGALRTGESKLLGAIDPERVRKVIRDHEAQVRSCYEQQLARDPKVEGKVSIRWQIDSDGHASNATVNRTETTFPGDEVPECIMSRVVTWEFPKPSSGGLAIVTYPWILRTMAANGATSEAKRAAPPEATRGPPRTTR